MSPSVHVVPLGGLGEVGMNCLAIEQDGVVLLVDCGVTFDDRGLGVDVVHPDFACLERFAGRVAGVFLTHGHEDHIGALPYLLRRFDVPVWGPPYALGLVRERLVEHEVLAHAHLVEAAPRRRVEIGPFVVEPVRVTHSIADALALSIKTGAGTLLHTGDFKFDESPSDGEAFDVDRLAAIAKENGGGVNLLLSDSTNVDAEGTAGDESVVRDALLARIAPAKGRVVVSMFASNVHRLRFLGEIARQTGRKIVPLGRSVLTHSKVAHATGYLSWGDDLIMPAERAAELPRDRVLGIATGSQAEANAALARLARDEHLFKLEPGDTLILSARAIPGHEPDVIALMGDFLRKGVDVVSRATDRGIHVSGHAHRSEQRRMIDLVRPRAFVPLHGTVHHLVRHADLAREAGVESVCVLENGDVGSLAAGAMSKVDRWATGRVHVFAGKPIGKGVLRERGRLAAEGAIVVVVPVDASGRRAGRVQVTSVGVVEGDVATRLHEEAAREAAAAIDELFRETSAGGSGASKGPGGAAVSDAARFAARRVFARETGTKPQTVATLVPVGDGAPHGAPLP